MTFTYYFLCVLSVYCLGLLAIAILQGMRIRQLEDTVNKMRALFNLSGPALGTKIEDGSSRFVINGTSSWDDIDDE